MHEVSLCQGIIEQVESELEKYPNQKIVSITLNIGALQLVVEESLEFAFRSLTIGGKLEHTQLIQKIIPAKALCLSCKNEFERSSLYELCSNCGSYNLKSLSGMEIIIEKMELSYV